MLTKQQAFDTVAKHLFAQGERSMADDGITCLYRGKNGLKCAVGALIPDAEYKDHFERLAASSIADDAPSLIGVNLSFLDELQLVHDVEDCWRSDQSMKTALDAVASNHDLDPAILDTLSFNRPAEG